MLLEFTKSVVVWNKARAFNKKDLHDKLPEIKKTVIK